MLSGMLRVLVVSLVLLVAAMFLLPRPGAIAPPAVATVLPETLPLPAFELVDQHRRDFTLEDLRGRFTLVFFGFTNCPDICPLTLQTLVMARAEIEQRSRELVPAIVFVSVDPQRDSAERIASYLENFHSELVGITGPDDALAPLLTTLGVTVEKHTHGRENYNVVHNPHVYVIGPEAEWIAVSSAPHDAATLAADYVKIRRRYSATHTKSSS